MGESEQNSKDAQGDAQRTEHPGNQYSESFVPQMDVEAVKPPSKFLSLWNRYGKKKPKVSDQHHSPTSNTNGSGGNKRWKLRLPDWISAFSAAGAFFVAFVMGVLSIYGYKLNREQVEITRGQLNEMRDSSKQTDRLVDAASNQAKAIEELKSLSDQQVVIMRGLLDVLKGQGAISIIQLRANVVSDGHQSVPIVTDGNRITGFRFNAFAKNIGSTDAIGFISRWSIAYEARREKPPTTCPEQGRIESAGRRNVLPPQGMQIQSALDIPIDKVIQAQQGVINIYSLGRIEYRDAFEGTPNHFYEWCIRIVPNDISGNRFSYFNEYHKRDY